MAEKNQTPDTPHLATARKWRPQVFGDIVGQANITTTLRNAVGSGRVGHAYLFSGPRGVGKTTTARILARAINCLSPKDADPDNACEICKEITEGRSLNVFEIDGASNRGVDEIRNLRDAVRYGPGKGKYKVYIIDEVHMLTKEAFNALLKTLEEPPAWVVFIFATTEVHRVPPTIVSRCQRFEFRRIAASEIVSSLGEIAKKEKVVIDDAALELIARKADGSLRDSQSIFDQVVSFCGSKIGVEDVRSLLKTVDDEFYFRVSEAVAARDAGAAFAIVEEVSRSGSDLREFAGGLAEHFRNLLVVRSTGDTALVDGSERIRKRCAETAAKFAEADLLRLMKIASDTEAAMRWSQQPRLKLELALQLMVSMEPGVRLAQLLSELEELKKKVDGGGSPRSVAAPAPGAGAEHPPLNDTSPAPVRGTVKASQPTLRSDQFVSPAVTMMPVAPSMPSAARMPSDTPMPATDITAAVAQAGSIMPSMKFSTGSAGAHSDTAAMPEAAAFPAADWATNWRRLVGQLRKEKIAVGSMLAETSFHAASGNSISIACPDGFHADLLKRNRQYISELAERFYGARFQFESILAAVPAGGGQADAGDSRPAGGAHAPRSAVRLRENPVAQALIREFGAEEIE